MFQVLVPFHRRKWIRSLKYIFALIGLFSAFLVFRSSLQAFLFSLLIFSLSSLIERIAFTRPAEFIHPLPSFAQDPDKWVGVGLGYAEAPDKSERVPTVGMILTDRQYATNCSNLVVSWVRGENDDNTRNVAIRLIVISPTEYIFFCYSNPNRPVTRRWFAHVRDKLRQTSLEDVIVEHHALLILGKRCAVGPESVFPRFRRMYQAGMPVVFGFYLPPFGRVSFAQGLPTFRIHDFAIQEKRSLTRRDLVFDLVSRFEEPAEYQGPPGQL